MGRSKTGAIHHFEALKLGISYLQARTAKNSVSFNRTCEWTCNGNYHGAISYDVSFDPHNRFLRLKYTHTDMDGVRHPMDYKIDIVGVPSNLGKGENLYFVCPVTHKLCKILYSCYGSKYFMSREAYPHRIYYTSQMYSKKDRVNNYYFELENEVKDLKRKQVKWHYKKEETRLQKRIAKLKLKAIMFDVKSWGYFEKSFLKLTRRSCSYEK